MFHPSAPLPFISFHYHLHVFLLQNVTSLDLQLLSVIDYAVYIVMGDGLILPSLTWSLNWQSILRSQ